MATIKAIEGHSVHRIQSGQVIVDLCSVVKELVENSLDAGATSIDIRFRDNGLDAIEVQDNGEGIPPESYETVGWKRLTDKALKHYTSKLSSYADLDSLDTFGFRGEALSSLCAVSELHIVTSRASEAPRGTKLRFDRSGRLNGTQAVATQKGTTIVVESLFKSLPVRRRELEKNIKREYGKVLGVLQAYACISTGVRFVVSNQIPNGRKAVAFATGSNRSTRENIMNVFGAKIMASLMQLDLNTELQPNANRTQKLNNDTDGRSKTVRILGHISRPFLGEGRQAPDRQMFFVNKRPCGLPQLSKAINEVYRVYNAAQSPFLFVDLKMDTNAYDVNVSPDKRTILLHDQSALLESIKAAITELLEKQDHTIPQTQMGTQKLPAFKQLSISRSSTDATAFATVPTEEPSPPEGNRAEGGSDPSSDTALSPEQAPGSNRIDMLQDFIRGKAVDRGLFQGRQTRRNSLGSRLHAKEYTSENSNLGNPIPIRNEDISDNSDAASNEGNKGTSPARDLAETQSLPEAVPRDHVGESPNRFPSAEEQIATASPMRSQTKPGVVQSAFDRSRPIRRPADTAVITIGSKTITSPMKPSAAKKPRLQMSQNSGKRDSSDLFAESLRTFTAPSTQAGRFDDQGLHSQPANAQLNNELEIDEASSSSDEEQGSNVSNKCPGSASDSSMEDVEEATGKDHRGSETEDSDGEYYDEGQKRAEDEAKVLEMIHEAEEHEVQLDEHNSSRLRALKLGGFVSDSTSRLVQRLHTSIQQIQEQLAHYNNQQLREYGGSKAVHDSEVSGTRDVSAEEQLSLTVCKDDFRRMRIVGQFNLGFILTVRYPAVMDGIESNSSPRKNAEELFIIDQHASDEIYNFERLQAQTIVQNQPLVSPRRLDLTAIEEEIILENLPVLEKNGFKVEIDDQGDYPVGRRCKLVSLPMSREVIFDTRDLEELLALLAEAPPATKTVTTTTTSSSSPSSSARAPPCSVPRPSKVRRMFAMRACRSSIMVGRTLTPKQMAEVVRHMGEMDKPWNCPHGRPTMRHLLRLDGWRGWQEGCGLASTTAHDKEEHDDHAIFDHDDVAPWNAWTTFLTQSGGGGAGHSQVDEHPTTQETDADSEEEDDDGDGLFYRE